MEAVEWKCEHSFQLKPLKDILTSKVLTVSPETSLSEAANLMGRYKISCLVIETDGRPTGIFTERDFVRAVQLKTNSTAMIESFMTQPVVTARNSIDIYEAYNLLLKNRIRHLVVVDSKGNISGVVTQSDIMRNLTMGFFVEAKNISRIMKRDVVTIKRTEMLEEALHRMVEYSISCLVVEEEGYPIGILTGRDVVRLYFKGLKLSDISVEEVMSSPVFTVQMNISIFEASRIMGDKRIRRLVVLDEEGKIMGLITQSDIISILERRYTESVEMIIMRLKEDIISNVSHELKTPVTILKSALQLAMEEDSKEEAGKLFKMALNSVDRLNSIVDDLVTAANNCASLNRSGFEELDLSILLPSFISKITGDAAERNIVLQTAIPKNLPKVKGNLIALQRAFHNILDNSLKFSKDSGGEVFITAEEGPTHVKVSVSDNGIGIPADRIEQIFAPLYQVDASTSRKYEGLGMGLTISEGIIKSHGGRIWVESTPSERTTVHFTLPVTG